MDPLRTDWLAPARTPSAGAGRPAAPPAGLRLQAAHHLAASHAAPEFAGWAPVPVPADVAQDPIERATIEGRAADLERNEALVAGAVASHKNTAIGGGFEFRATPDYEALGLDRDAVQDGARRIEAVWREWSEDAEACDIAAMRDFGQLTRLSGTHDVIDGESIGLLRWEPERQGRRGVRFATTFQVVEPARLGNPIDRWNDRNLRDGVRIDPETGEPLGYFLRAAHPNDPWALADRHRWVYVDSRFPDGGAAVVHSFDQKWAGQHRGVSWISPIMGELKMAHRYKRAELQAAVVNAVMAAVLETPLDGQGLVDLFGDSQTYLAQARTTADPVTLGIGPGGLIPRLFPGEKLTSYASARPNAQFDQFLTALGRHAAAGMGQPYEVFMRDFSKTNYSSARAALLEGWRSILAYRLLKAVTWCKPVLAGVIDEAVWRGYLVLPGYTAGRRFRQAWLRGLWLGPARGWVDPVKEIQAAALRIRLGISSLRDEAQEQGRDWRELLDQLAVERRELAARGLSLPEVPFLAPADDAREDPAAA